jgi:hypothetical protein
MKAVLDSLLHYYSRSPLHPSISLPTYINRQLSGLLKRDREPLASRGTWADKAMAGEAETLQAECTLKAGIW